MELSEEAKKARRLYKRQWNRANREHVNAYKRRWRRENPEKDRANRERWLLRWMERNGPQSSDRNTGISGK